MPLVREMHRLGNGFGQFRSARRAQWLVAGERRRIAALDHFHRNMRLAVVLAHFVDGNNVRMTETGRHLGLAAKAEGVLGEVWCEQNFDRYQPVEAHLTRAIDHPHAATGNFLQQLVVAERAEDPGSLADGRVIANRFASQIRNAQTDETSGAIVVKPAGSWRSALRTFFDSTV